MPAGGESAASETATTAISATVATDKKSFLTALVYHESDLHDGILFVTTTSIEGYRMFLASAKQRFRSLSS